MLIAPCIGQPHIKAFVCEYGGRRFVSVMDYKAVARVSEPMHKHNNGLFKILLAWFIYPKHRIDEAIFGFYRMFYDLEAGIRANFSKESRIVSVDLVS